MSTKTKTSSVNTRNSDAAGAAAALSVDDFGDMMRRREVVSAVARAEYAGTVGVMRHQHVKARCPTAMRFYVNVRAGMLDITMSDANTSVVFCGARLDALGPAIVGTRGQDIVSIQCDATSPAPKSLDDVIAQARMCDEETTRHFNSNAPPDLPRLSADVPTKQVSLLVDTDGSRMIDAGTPAEPVDGVVFRKRKCLLRYLLATIRLDSGLSMLAVVMDPKNQRRPDIVLTGRRALPDLSVPMTMRAALLPDFELGRPSPKAVRRKRSGRTSASAIVPDAGTLTPSRFDWLTRSFEIAGGLESEAYHAQRRSAPMVLRLFHTCMAALATDLWDGQEHRVSPTINDLVDWLYPNGLNRQPRAEVLGEIQNALYDLYDIQMPLRIKMIGAPEGLYRVPLMVCRAFPEAWGGKETVAVIDVVIPPERGPGIQVDFDRMRRYGARSYTLYKAYLSTAVAMHASAHHGAPQQAMIAAAKTDVNGKTIRRGGRVVRDGARLEPNPNVRYVQAWTDETAAQLIYGSLFRKAKPDNRRQLKVRARQAIAALESDGVLEVATQKDGTFKLLAPRKKPA